MSEIIWLIYILINYTFIVLAFKKWGKVGVFMFVPISIILANIQVSKLMHIFGVDTTMGNIAYSGVFIASDILTENYGKDVAKKSVGIGFFTMIATTIFMSLAIAVSPSESDTSQEHLKYIFGNFSRFTVASLTAYYISSTVDIHLYQWIKSITPSFKYIWIRNNASTLISQIVDNIIFTTIAFTGKYSISLMISIAFSTYFLKIITSLMDTPFVYIATYLKNKGKIKEVE